MSFKSLDTLLTHYTTKKQVAGCVCCVARKKKVLFLEAYGYSQIVPHKIKCNRQTIFDLASLTKPLATALTTMQLCERKNIHLNDKAGMYLPQFRKSVNGEKTIRQLLTHVSGLPAWFPLYILPADQRLQFLANTNSNADTVTYSCLGYIILHMILEKVTSTSLDAYCQEEIYDNVGIQHTFFGPTQRHNVAATECGNQHEKQLAATYGDTDVKWRSYVIKGEVHDGNAHYCFNGVSGNAGLFSNARDLLKLINHYCGGTIVSPATVKLMTKNWTGTPDQRGLGWVINPYPKLFSNGTFSHSGFTGTLCIIDPVSDIIVILLTNAVHPTVRQELTAALRHDVATQVSRAINA